MSMLYIYVLITKINNVSKSNFNSRLFVVYFTKYKNYIIFNRDQNAVQNMLNIVEHIKKIHSDIKQKY